MGNAPAFDTEVIEWNWIESKELTANRNPAPPIKGTPKRIAVTCLTCGNTWEARKRGTPTKGSFTALAGNVLIWCPNCDLQEHVMNKDL